MVTQIEQMLVEAWEKFCHYYDTKAPRYQDSWLPKLKKEQAKESHWICWDENDLTFHIGRFFYDILKEKKESLFSNIEIHLEKLLDPRQFRDYLFLNRLKTRKLGKLGKLGTVTNGMKIRHSTPTQTAFSASKRRGLRQTSHLTSWYSGQSPIYAWRYYAEKLNLPNIYPPSRR